MHDLTHSEILTLRAFVGTRLSDGIRERRFITGEERHEHDEWLDHVRRIHEKLDALCAGLNPRSSTDGKTVVALDLKATYLLREDDTAARARNHYGLSIPASIPDCATWNGRCFEWVHVDLCVSTNPEKPCPST